MARHESAGISGIFRAFATQPGGMHWRLKCEVIFARALRDAVIHCKSTDEKIRRNTAGLAGHALPLGCPKSAAGVVIFP